MNDATPFTRVAGAVGACAFAANLAMLPLRNALPDLVLAVRVVTLGLTVLAYVGLLYRVRAEGAGVIVVVLLDVAALLLTPSSDTRLLGRIAFVLGTMALGALVVMTDGLPLGAGLLMAIAAPLVFVVPLIALLALAASHVTLYVAMWLERPQIDSRAGIA